MSVLSIKNLSKNYGKIKAVQALNLEIAQGEIYGILGPNGSGKTTTLGMILDIIRPSSGDYSWFGSGASADLRKRIGAILETPNFYPYMNAIKNLKIVAQIKGVDQKEIPKVLEVVGLSQRATSAFKTFSLGMKQRLAIAAALLGDPEVLIFDEPTNGLDPQGIVDVRELLIEIGKQGKTILLASHIIDEVEKVCTHAAIIKNGVLLASGAVAELLSTDPVFELAAEDLQALEQVLKNASWTKDVKRDHQLLQLQLKEAIPASALNRYLYEQGHVLTHLVERKKSLESEFLERTQILD
jgi:ABC-type multidrug transport system ATPase subunit